MDRPMELIQSSFSFSESAMKYMVSDRVESSKAYSVEDVFGALDCEAIGHGDDAMWLRDAGDG